MHDRRHRPPLRRLGLVGAAALAAGACAHNDVLVFGTSTTIGLNIETASANGAAPSIVLGYEREEAVWMPLAVNGWGARTKSCGLLDWNCVADPTKPTWLPGTRLYQSSTPGPNGARLDTYSVFASLGAKFNAEANDGAEAGGGLAQFFATGAAAVNVTQNPALVTVLKVESAEGAAAQAEAVEAALSPEQRADLEARQAQRRSRVDAIIACVATDKTTWKALVEATVPAADADDRSYLLEGVGADDERPAGEIERLLRGETSLTSRLAGRAAQVCTGT